VQAYFNGRQVRITEPCYRKTVSFKGVCINHLWTQINSFVLGDREASKRADDLLDAAVVRSVGRIPSAAREEVSPRQPLDNLDADAKLSS
jgi:hypothetical protein